MEIKFRVRDIKTNEVIAYEFLNDQFSNGLIWNTEHVGGEIVSGSYDKDGVYREQYIGLKTSAGNEIYAGDKTYHIAHDVICKIIWHEKHACFCGYDEDNDTHYYYQTIDEKSLSILNELNKRGFK